MRARGVTLYSKRSPYLKSNAEPIASTESPCLPQKRLSIEEASKLFEDFGPLVQDCSHKDSFSGDFHNSLSESFDSSSTDASSSIPSLLTLSRLSSKSIREELFDEDVKINKLFRGMIIGARSTGKHALIDAMYPDFRSQEEHSCRKQEFDLITGKNETEESVERFHFWLKESKQEGSHYRAVISSYYKSCSAFFLMYDANDRASFECLEDEINLIRQASHNKEANVFLIGNKRAGSKCEVSCEEAMLYKEKYNLKGFLEVDISSSESVDDVRDIIKASMK